MQSEGMEIHHKDGLELMGKMDDNSVDAIITDPHYEWSEPYQRECHSQMLRVSRRCVIVFSKPENQWNYNPDQICSWVKPISTKNTSRNYSRFFEMIFIYELAKYYWDNSRHWSNYVNVFNDRIIDERVHPHQKPLSLMRKLVLNHTREEDLILDPFAGSGTTLIAAADNGRQAIGAECDDDMYEVLDYRLSSNGIFTI